MFTILSASRDCTNIHCALSTYKEQRIVWTVKRADSSQYLKWQILLSSTSFPHYHIPLLSPFPLQNIWPRNSSCQARLLSQRYLLLSFISILPSTLSFSNQSLIFDLIVKCVELNECAWKKIGCRWGDSPNLFVEMEYGNEKARTETIKNTLSPVFPDKQIIVTP